MAEQRNASERNTSRGTQLAERPTQPGSEVARAAAAPRGSEVARAAAAPRGSEVARAAAAQRGPEVAGLGATTRRGSEVARAAAAQRGSGAARFAVAQRGSGAARFAAAQPGPEVAGAAAAQSGSGAPGAESSSRSGSGATPIPFAAVSFVCGLVGLLVANLVLGPLAIVLGAMGLRADTNRRVRATLGILLGVADIAVFIFLAARSGAHGGSVNWNFFSR